MKFLRYPMVTVLTFSPGFLVLGMAQEGAAAVKIVIQEGQNAVNVLANNSAVSPVIEIRDKSDRPLAGARVTFVLPKDSPRAVFGEGKNSVSVPTGSDGRAKAPEMHPLGVGKFEITIQADYRGQVATSTIIQINVQKVEEVSAARAEFAGQGASTLKIQVLEGDDGVNIIDKGTAVKSVVRIVDKNDLPVAGIAVAVAVVATRGGSKADFSNNKTTITVTTNISGIAEVAELHPAGNGSFQIQIQVNADGQMVTRTIAQTNYPTERVAIEAGKIPGTSKGDLPEGGKPLQVKVVRGNDGTNVVKNKIVAQQIVEVDDSSGLPLDGVKVAFVLPDKGARAVFVDGNSFMIVTTDANGRAEAGRMLLSGKGSFRIIVLVAYQGVSASSVILQTNFTTVAAARKAGKTPGSSQGDSTTATGNMPGTTTGSSAGMSAATKALLVVGIIAGAAGGVAAAAGSKNSSNSSSATNSVGCSADLVTKLLSDIQVVLNSCPSTSGQGQCVNASGSCSTACQNTINDLSPLCSSCGLSLPSDLSQSITQAGLTLPAGCH